MGNWTKRWRKTFDVDMKKTMIYIAVIVLLLTVVLSLVYESNRIVILFSLAITMGTIAYHIWMRLLVGLAFDSLMCNKADISNRWYQIRTWEKKLYKTLGVKKWKTKMPTFVPDYFSHNTHSWDEIAQAMCQSELVHEVIVILSFVPIITSIWFGALPVFIITSTLAALFDLIFVIIQRYNRTKIIMLMRRQRNERGI